MNNLIKRTLTGIAFVGLVVGAILLSGWVLFAVFLLFTCLGMHEYRTLLRQGNVNLSLTFYVVGLLVYLTLSITPLWEMVGVMAIMALLFMLFVIELFLKQGLPFRNIAYSVLGILWIVVPFAVVNRFPPSEGRFLLLSVFVFIWLYDTFAYCVGMLIGNHRLFERISPKKSWEGAIGSTLFTLTAAYFAPLMFPMLELNSLQWMGLALVIIVFGTFGDLTESLFKRQSSVKDSGSILPGHGGILDRFDSLLFAMPFVLLYLSLIVNC